MATQEKQTSPADIRAAVRENYGRIAGAQESDPQVQTSSGCCGPTTAVDTSAEDVTASGCGCGSSDVAAIDMLSRIYETPDVAALPDDVTDLSLGCGDPVTLASLQPGQTVLDLGSGGGIDCFLAAQRVGEIGQVIGVDMTPAMIDKARANKAKVDAENIEFRLGEIEHLPVSDNTIDVIISNCVINLSPDKPQVFREAYRTLKPGGKLAVSDIVTDGPLPDAIKQSLSAWAGCIGGAMDINDYVAAMEAAGFVDVGYTAVYPDKETADAIAEQMGLSEIPENGKPALIMQTPDGPEIIDLGDMDEEALRKTIFSAKITAYKPA